MSHDATTDDCLSPSTYSASVSTTTASLPTTVLNLRNSVVTCDRYSLDCSQASITASRPCSVDPPTETHCTSCAKCGYASANRWPENACAICSIDKSIADTCNLSDWLGRPWLCPGLRSCQRGPRDRRCRRPLCEGDWSSLILSAQDV